MGEQSTVTLGSGSAGESLQNKHMEAELSDNCPREQLFRDGPSTQCPPPSSALLFQSMILKYLSESRGLFRGAGN